MKVIVTKRPGGLFDCRIRRTRKSEGDNVTEKGLDRAALHNYVSEQVKAIAPVPLPNT